MIGSIVLPLYNSPGVRDRSGTAKKTISNPRNHYVELDALRGIAIIGTIMTHLSLAWTSSGFSLRIPLLNVDAANSIAFWGTGGLNLFFLLSGYLLSWMEEKRAKPGIYSVRSYVLRRVLRLMPAYYMAILVVVVLWPLNPPYPMEISPTDVLIHASFLHALNPYTINGLDPAWWSLTPEVIFYCLLPFLVLKLRRVSQRLVLFGVFALITLGPRVYTYMMQIIPDPTTPPTFNFWYVQYVATGYMYIFLAGVLLRMLVEYLNSRPSSRLRLQLAQLATALFLIGILLMIGLLYLGMTHPLVAAAQGQNPWPLLQTVIPFEQLIVILFFASAVLGSPLLRAVLRWRFLAFTGMISYSMFLLHQTVLIMVGIPYLLPAVRYWVVGQGSLVVWTGFCGYTLAILAIAFVISYLSYRYVESPFLRSKPT